MYGLGSEFQLWGLGCRVESLGLCIYWQGLTELPENMRIKY